MLNIIAVLLKRLPGSSRDQNIGIIVTDQNESERQRTFNDALQKSLQVYSEANMPTAQYEYRCCLHFWQNNPKTKMILVAVDRTNVEGFFSAVYAGLNKSTQYFHIMQRKSEILNFLKKYAIGWIWIFLNGDGKVSAFFFEDTNGLRWYSLWLKEGDKQDIVIGASPMLSRSERTFTYDVSFEFQ